MTSRYQRNPIRVTSTMTKTERIQYVLSRAAGEWLSAAEIGKLTNISPKCVSTLVKTISDAEYLRESGRTLYRLPTN